MSFPAPFLSSTCPLHAPPELAVADDRHDVAPGGEAPDLHQLQAADAAGDLQGVGPPTHQHVGPPSRGGLHGGSRPLGGGDRVAPRPAQKAGERHPLTEQILHPPELRCGARMLQRRDQLARRLIALAAYAEAAVNHFFQVIAAGQRAHVAAANHAAGGPGPGPRTQDATSSHGTPPPATPAPRGAGAPAPARAAARPPPPHPPSPTPPPTGWGRRLSPPPTPRNRP